ncbi:hypothetical protein AN219_38095 [Streptomyces nanshensis]|nr:hypothetical protein AN219_38095 [Streptomyces nanshensis]
MELISSAERNLLIEACEHDSFHLELRDDYSVPDEDGPFESWLRNEPVDYSYMEPWKQMVKRLAGDGKTVRRARIVTEPHTPYIQWEHLATAHNVEAGEDVRWLPRHQVPEGLNFPFDGRDWWLIDDSILAVGHINDTGRVQGHEVTEDPRIVTDAVALRNQLWAAAIPHREYKP